MGKCMMTACPLEISDPEFREKSVVYFSEAALSYAGISVE